MTQPRPAAMIGSREPMLRAAARGAAAGTAATLAMSAVMLGANRLGIMRKQPPERVVERASAATGTPMSDEEVDVAASLAHIAFGALSGAAFGTMDRAIRPTSAAVLALPWAVVIWAVSYFGWIPALRILPPPAEDDPGRAWTMLASHLVYGAALAAAWRAAGGRRGWS